MIPVQAKRIITLPHPCLTRKATPITTTVEGLAEGKEIIRHLIQTLEPYMPAAGLAAPQIGISKCVMIFSWNRSREHLVGAINPSYEPMDDQVNFSWEGCFSVPLVLVNVPRYQNIKASYMTLEGKPETFLLSGFAARVFQHECDHLDGLETIHKAGAKIHNFSDTNELITFLNEVRKGDQAHYIKPQKMEKEQI